MKIFNNIFPGIQIIQGDHQKHFTPFKGILRLIIIFPEVLLQKFNSSNFQNNKNFVKRLW